MEDENETKDGKPAKDQTKRYEKLGFKPQKELYVNKYLPYADKIDDESSIFFEEIKINMAKCIGMREINPGAGIFASKLLWLVFELVN
jgi:proteasome activator subunit 4